jgi:hypothetical protein
VSSSVVPCWFEGSDCHSFHAASTDSALGYLGLPLGTNIGIVTKLTTLEASSVGGLRGVVSLTGVPIGALCLFCWKVGAVSEERTAETAV